MYVPYEHLPAAIKKLYGIRDKFLHLVIITELRMMARDGLPMSQAKNGPIVGIHFTMKREHEKILEVLPIIEGALAEFGVKPHFGKMFLFSGAKFEQLYGEDLVKLRQLIAQHDPKGKFKNAFLEKYILRQAKL